MADRSTAHLFAEVFDFCLDLPAGKERNKFVRRLLAMTHRYDFAHCQMNADETLDRLGCQVDERGRFTL